MSDDPIIEADDLAICLAVLAAARQLASDDPRVIELERATAHLRKSAKQKRKKVRAEVARQGDKDKRATTGRWRDWDAGRLAGGGVEETREAEVGPGEPLHNEQRCYVCKQPYRELHFHYHLLCPGCAGENWDARSRRIDLAGRRALITGGRIKIGHEVALKLLRDGAEVLVTTRFPRDAVRRFASAPDFGSWRERLRVIGVDLRFLPGVIGLAERLRAEGRALDILVHNAAQTVARPPAWQRELAEAEAAPLAEELLGLIGLIVEGDQSALGEAVSDPGLAALAITPSAPEPFLARFHALCRSASESEVFPRGRVDEEQRPLDLRERNSWSLGLDEVEPVELVEAQLVNAIAPALLTSRLRPLLDASEYADRHVVFVTAVEGQFAYARKTHRHPHTNMAKAALHMITRTSADEWAKSGIYMVSVDTGWVTQEHPEATKQRLAQRGFRPPLDIVDGAARVYDPIVRGGQGEPIWGCLLKDYRVAPW